MSPDSFLAAAMSPATVSALPPARSMATCGTNASPGDAPFCKSVQLSEPPLSARQILRTKLPHRNLCGIFCDWHGSAVAASPSAPW